MIFSKPPFYRQQKKEGRRGGKGERRDRKSAYVSFFDTPQNNKVVPAILKF